MVFLQSPPDPSLNIHEVIKKNSYMEDYLKGKVGGKPIAFDDNKGTFDCGVLAELFIGEVYLFYKHMKLYKEKDYLRMPVMKKTEEVKNEIKKNLETFDSNFFDYIQNYDKDKIMFSFPQEDEAWIQKLRTIGKIGQK